MRQIGWLCLSVVFISLSACNISKVYRDGPKPRPESVVRTGGDYSEPVFCTDQGGTLVISFVGYTTQEIEETCQVYREYIARELVWFDFDSFFRGMADAMKEQGYSFSPDDPLVMLY